MKKKIVGLVVLACMLLACAFGLSACGENNLINGTEISAANLTVDGLNVYGKVSNATETYSFINEISVSDSATFEVYRDLECERKIASKTTTLSVGDNVFYILVENGKDLALYTVTVRRRPIYTVTFNTNGGSRVLNQQIEEDGFATKPDSNPTKLGYMFNSWDFDFNTPINSNKTVTASWLAKTDTEYKVEYYLQNLEDNDYTLKETSNLTGTTDTTANAEIKTYEHFTPTSQRVSGNINGDGKQVLKVYYTRNKYTLSNANTSYGSITNSGTYKYGTEQKQTTVTEFLGCEFVGWFNGENLLSTEKSYIFTVTENITAKFKVKDEMSNYEFIASAVTCTITGIKDKTVTSIVVPDYVIEISEGAFRFCELLQSVTISRCVLSIGRSAFDSCSSLKSIIIPDSVQSIGRSAFYGCSSLQEMTIPFVGGSKKVTSSSSSTLFGYIFGTSSYTGSVATTQYYSGSSYQIYYIPSSLKSVKVTGGNILYGAFYGCSSLESVTIGNSVQSIGDYAFYGCSSLESVTIGGSVMSIGYSAFQNCPCIERDKGLFYVDNWVIKCDISATNEVIKEKTVGVANQAFSGCRSLQSIIIPDSVQSIGNQAFKDCPIKKATISTRAIACISKNNLKTVTINGGEQIDDNAFSGCSSLESVIIGNGVQSIGNRAFAGCNSLKSIIIPDSVQSIGNDAFYGCSSLQYNVFDYGLYLGNNENSYLVLVKAITSCVIHDSCRFVLNDAFSNCSSLQFNEYDNGLYFGNDKNPYLVLVKAKSKDIISCMVQDDCRFVLDSAFSGCSLLESVAIGNSVQNIGTGAFAGCSSLKSVIIPNSVKNIGRFIFHNCISLQSAVIGDSVQCISDFTFEGCNSIQNVVIGNGVQNIGSEVFYDCNKLSKVYYKGDSEGWNKITIDFHINSQLTNATRYYYSENKPQGAGNYWHYDTDGVTVLEWEK